MAGDTAFMDKLTALCKRRGFIYQSSEIYGGIGGFWDYGPLGVELKRNIKNQWWHDMVINPPDGPDGREIQMVGLDCSIIMNPKVWEASGHVGGFSDPMVDCRNCKSRFRADHILRAYVIPAPQLDSPDGITWELIQQLVSIKEAEFANLPYATVQADQSPSDAMPAIRDALGDKRAKLHVITLKAPHSDRDVAFEVYESRGAIRLISRTFPGNDSLVGGERCPKCGGELTAPRQFNLMFQTHVGALQDASSVAYLRPETAQGIFANFLNVLDTSRVKVPFGIAQVGKAFRNEINPRNYTFRSREFEQMEIEFFCHPDEHQKWYEFWRSVRSQWYENLGLRSEKVRLRDHVGDELAHYASACADVEYLFPFSDEHQELEGIAHRGCYDLEQHQKHSGKDLTYFDDDAWERVKDQYPDKAQAKEVKNKPPYRFLPHVIEPSAGADRATLAFLCEAYTEDEQPDEKGKLQSRTVMKFHPKLAPIKAAIFPLVNKEGMPEIAEAIYRDVKKHMPAALDVKGAIGRRYRRQDEIGTPFCLTVDGETLENGTVTVRHRDSLEQSRIAKDQVLPWLREHLG